MTKKERYQVFLDYFLTHQPNPTTELIYANAFELLVAVVLSAQCTDKRINQVTPPLFARFPTPEMLAQATQEEVYHLIRTVSYPNNKAKHLIGLSKEITQRHQGKVPQDVETLQTLPGVGRKSAHVVAATLYDKPTLGVDTHVFRVAKRLGLAGQSAKTPLAVEKELLEHLLVQGSAFRRLFTARRSRTREQVLRKALSRALSQPCTKRTNIRI